MRTLRRGGIWLRGHVLTVLLIAGVSGLLTLGGLLSVRLPGAAAVVAALVPDGDLFVEAKLSVDRAIVAGIDTGSVTTLLADLGAADGEARAVSAKRLLAEGLCAQVSDLRDRAAAEPWDAELGQELATAEASMGVALRDLASARDRLLLASCARLDGDTVGRLDAYCSSKQSIGEAEFRRIATSDEELRTLELALIAERRAQRRGEQLDESIEVLLSDARSDLAVVEARVALGRDRAAIQRTVEAFGNR